MFMDVSVNRGAYCNTDHQLMCAKLRLKKPHTHAERKERRFDVAQLIRDRKDDNDEGSDQSMKVCQEQVLTRSADVR